MKIWGVLCLLACVSDLDARIIDIPDKEDKPEPSVVSRIDEGAQKGESLEETKVDLSSALKAASEDLNASQKEEKPDFLIVNTTDTSSPPGGGVRLLDADIANTVNFPVFLEPPAPWWERWWNQVSIWLFGEES